MTGTFRCGVAVLVAGAAVLLVSPAARADEFTFHDDGDVMFVSHDSGSQTVNILCTSYENFCSMIFSRQDVFVVHAAGPLGQPIPQDDNIYTTRVDEEPGIGQGVQSDRLYTHANGHAVIQELYSDMASMEGDSFECRYHNSFPCTVHPELTLIVETGLRQLAATITWSDDRIDTFYFISEVSEAPPVPEPASLFLLGSGLIAGVRHWRKARTNP